MPKLLPESRLCLPGLDAVALVSTLSLSAAARAQAPLPADLPAPPPAASAALTSAGPAASGPTDTTQSVTIEGKAERPAVQAARRQAASAGFGDKAVLDTPYSVGIVTGAQLQELAITRIEDALKLVPGATQSYASGSYNYFNVRGNIPTVQIDGAQHWGRAIYSLDSVDQVELLKGPAALRGGFGGPGGVVNLVTKRPAAESVATAGITHDSFGGYRLSLDTTWRGDTTWGSRLNLSTERTDDQWGLPVERDFVSLANDLRIDGDLTLFLDIDRLIDRRRYSGEYNTDTEGRVLDLDPRRLYGQDWALQDTRATTLRAGARWRMAPGWMAKLQFGSYQYAEIWNATYMLPVQANGDYELSWLGSMGERRGVNAQASVTGTADLGGMSHELTFAVQQARARSNVAYNDGATLGTSNIAAPVAFAPRDIGVTPGPYTHTRESSLIATDEVKLLPNWSALLGVRHSRYSAEANDYRTSATLPIGALLYKPAADVTAYLSYAASLEPGNTAPADATNAGEQLEARHSEQFELGAKWLAWDDRLFLSAAIFRIRADYYGYINSAGRYVQDGWQDIHGAELSFEGRLDPSWSVQGGVGYTRDVLRDTGDPVQDGQQSPSVPRDTASLTVSYRAPWSPGLRLNAGVYRTGSFTAYNYDLGRLIALPSTTTVGLGVAKSWSTDLGRSELRIQVANALNERGWQPAFYPLAPRQTRITYEHSF